MSEDSVNNQDNFNEAIKKYDALGNNVNKIKSSDNFTKNNEVADVHQQILEQLKILNGHNERTSKNVAFIAWAYIIGISLTILAGILFS